MRLIIAFIPFHPQPPTILFYSLASHPFPSTTLHIFLPLLGKCGVCLRLPLPNFDIWLQSSSAATDANPHHQYNTHDTTDYHSTHVHFNSILITKITNEIPHHYRPWPSLHDDPSTWLADNVHPLVSNMCSAPPHVSCRAHFLIQDYSLSTVY